MARTRNREKERVSAAAWRTRNLEKARASVAAWRARNPEKVRELRARNATDLRIRASTEMLIVAQSWGDDVPRCRADVTLELLDTPCRGDFQIDHINGGGRKETHDARVRGVLDGTRELGDLRVLCELHQARYAILRRNSTGGSDPKDWEE